MPPGTPPGPPGPQGYGSYAYAPPGYGAPHPAARGRPPAPKPGIIPLRPLGLGEILDGSFSAMRWNPKVILAPSVILAVVSGLLVAVTTYLMESGFLSHLNLSQRSGQLTPAQAQHMGETIAVVYAIYGLYAIVSFFGNAILTGFLTGVIGQAVLGRKEPLADAWRTVRSRIGPVIAAVLLQGLFIGLGWTVAVGLSVGLGFALGAGAHQVALGVLLGVVCGITATVFAVIVAVRWSFIVPAVVLEHAGPIRAMGRSWRLVRGSGWRVFGILLLSYVIVGFVSAIIRAPFGLGEFLGLTGSGGASVVGAVLSAVGVIIASTVTAPLWSGTVVLLYTDLRMRREGMDIALQAVSGIGAQPPAPGTQAPGGPVPGSPEPGAW